AIVERGSGAIVTEQQIRSLTGVQSTAQVGPQKTDDANLVNVLDNTPNLFRDHETQWAGSRERISSGRGGAFFLDIPFYRTHGGAPFRSLSWFARFQPGLALNRSGQELGPTQPSLRSLTAIKIPLFELPHLQGAGYPIITSVLDCTPSGFPGSPACQFGPAAR